jgi:hypothetical protein
VKKQTDRMTIRWLTAITILLFACQIYGIGQTQPTSGPKQKRVPLEGTQPKTEEGSSVVDDPQTTTDNQWHFQLSPYLWIAALMEEPELAIW